MPSEHRTTPLHRMVRSQALPSLQLPKPATPFNEGPWCHTWWLGDDYHVARQPDVAGGTALQRDGGALEMVQHVHHRREVQVLHSALAPLRE